MRHPRSSILCPNCRKLISSSESKCPFCGTRRPGSWIKNNAWTRGFGEPNQMIKLIIAVNVGMYILSLLFDPGAHNLPSSPLTFLSPSFQSLKKFGATGFVPIYNHHQYWTLISASYIHGGLLHIFFNMAVLSQLASIVSREYGLYRMFAIYTLSGVFGFLISYVFKVDWTIGASAAVCGLVGAIIYYGKSRGGVYGRALFKQIAIWVVFLFIIGMIPGLKINNYGHGGGIIAGIGLGFLLGYQEKRRENISHKLLAGSCALVTLLVLFFAISTALYSKLMG